MPRFAQVALLCCVISAAACGGKQPDSTPAPTPTPTPAPGERITGSERIGWEQQASDATELASFRYAIYVDGVRSELTDVTCAPGPPTFACSARLPALTMGTHTLEVASFLSDVGVIESQKSAPLRVTVGAAAVVTGPGAPGLGTSDGDRAFVSTSGTRVATHVIAEGLNEPTDLAFAPDGRIFVAERGGSLRVISDGRLDARAVGLVDEVDTRGGGGLLAVAIAPGFAQTHHVYVLQTATGRTGALTFRVDRYREVNGTLGDRVILLDDIPSAPVQPRGALRFGPDGLLYIAFDDAGDEWASGDRSSYSGKLLRLNADGSTPRDQSSPIIAEGFRSPRGFDWSPINGTLWMADVRSDGSEQLVAGSASYTLPVSTDTSGVAFTRTGVMLAGTDAMLRVPVDAGGAHVEHAERLSGEEGLTPVRVVAVSPAGEIYFCTDTTVGRLMP